MTNELHFAGNDFCLSADELTDELREALLDCGASGDASEAVAYVRKHFKVTGERLDCARYLKRYGAWENSELLNQDDNLYRLVWLAGCDLQEQGEVYFCIY